MTLTTFKIIYLIGYILAYIMLRGYFRKVKGKAYYTWGDVLANAALSLLSWGLVIPKAITTASQYVSKKVKINVPKWL